MNATLLIICHSQHQLEKGLFLKKILPNQVDIKCINFIPTNIKSKKNFSVVKSSQELIDNSNDYDRFIFFSIIPSKTSFEIVNAIRKSQKQIIVIQETHQLSISHGTINSIMISPDLIIAASDTEKDLMIQNKLFKKNTIISSGWVFQKKFHEFVHKEITQNDDDDFNNYLLVILSAPQTITSSSAETYQKRKEILEWVQKNNPNKKILIKLHPLEDRQKFIQFINMQNEPLVDFAPSHSNIYSLSLNAQNIVVSDQTQAFIDLVNINKKLIVYKLKDQNFISSFLSKTIKPVNYKEITFFEVANSIEMLEAFRSIHLKSEEECLLSIVKNINGPDLQINPLASIELALWEFIFGYSKKLNHRDFKNSEKIMGLFKNNRALNLNGIENEIKTISMKTSMTIYLINKIIDAKIINESQIKSFLHNFITSYFVQYFYLDLLRFKFFLNHAKVKMEIDKDSLRIMDNSQKVIQEKSFFIKLLIMIEAKIYFLKRKLIRTPIYILLNLSMKAVIRLKR